MSFMAKEELKENWLFAFLGWAFEAIYVKRDSKDIGPLKQSLTVLKSGNCLGIFPEGTINRTEDIIMPFKIGAVKMASETNTSIVPFTITGEYKVFKKSITIEFYKPMKIKSDNLTKENERLMGFISKKLEEKRK